MSEARAQAHARAHEATWRELGLAAAHALTTGALRPEEKPYLVQVLRDLATRDGWMSAQLNSHMSWCDCSGCREFSWRGKLLLGWNHDGQPGANATAPDRGI